MTLRTLHRRIGTSPAASLSGGSAALRFLELAVIQMTVEAAFFQQFFMSSLLNDLTVFHDQNTV